MPMDYSASRRLLDELFAEAEQALVAGSQPPAAPARAESFESIFASRTQAYREVLIGCALARLQDHSIDIRRLDDWLRASAVSGK